MFANASPLESGWTGTSLIGMLAWYTFLFLVIGDELRRRRTTVNGMVKLDITKGMVCGAILGTKAAGYMVAGLIAMSNPPSTGSGDPSSSAALILVILIFNNIALTALALYFLANRYQTNREMASGERRDRRASDRRPTAAAPS